MHQFLLIPLLCRPLTSPPVLAAEHSDLPVASSSCAIDHNSRSPAWRSSPTTFVAAVQAALGTTPDSRRRRPNELRTAYDLRRCKRLASWSRRRRADHGGPRPVWGSLPLEATIAKQHMILELGVDINFIF